jgi:hypothetical protein
MGKKINIAELLKDCPKGRALYSPIFGEEYLDKIRPHLAIVVTTDKEHGDFKEEFLYDGRYGMNGECMLYPSKGKTTWNGFVPPCQFKVGDIVQDKDGYKVRITEVSIEDECYGYESMIAKGIGGIPFNEQNNWQLVPNKFDITTLKPFDKVLVRENDDQLWTADIFSFKSNNIYPISCVGHYVNQCIPYEGNEHLLGKTDDCADYYKTWE